MRQDFDYDVIYWWSSHFVHGTILGLGGHEIEPGDVFRIRARIETECQCEEEALFNVLVFLSKIFICAFRGMKVDPPEELLTEIRSTIESYAGGRLAD